VPARGFEPRTLGLKDRCSNQAELRRLKTIVLNSSFRRVHGADRCCNLARAMSVVQTGWSADGNWFWDGARWNDALSEDGKWRFDGANWQTFAGQRTAMPAHPPYSSAPPAPSAWAGAQGAVAAAQPPAAPVAAAAAPLPAWVDPSEVERMERERREREAIAAQAPPPLPPEADWRLVGERMQYNDYSHNPNYASWQVGTTSIVIYILLLWLCGPISAIFVWMTGWSMTSKLITTAISLLGLIVALFLVFAVHLSPTTAG
jgi:hypothetical protein